ncbi:MAG: proton-conducting transporter transmembrane domain-containing protein [Thermoanaerobaculaceae bacterium]
MGSCANEVFGLLSRAVATVSIVGQPDYKSMLAYSSVEHVGILALGVGLGAAGVFGALLHAVNHSRVKAALFMLAGNILAVARSKTTAMVRGIRRILPVSGVLWVAGMLAITGSPAFGVLVSELAIARAAMDGGQFIVLRLFPCLLFGTFLSMGRTCVDMALGQPMPGIHKQRELYTGGAAFWYFGVAWVGPTGSADHLAPHRCRVPGRRVSAGRLRPIFPGEKVARVLPRLKFRFFADQLAADIATGSRISPFLGHPTDGGAELLALPVEPTRGTLRVGVSSGTGQFPSLTPGIPQAHLFARAIAEQRQVKPVGHPWLKPVRLQPPLCSAREAAAHADEATLGHTTAFCQVIESLSATVAPPRAQAIRAVSLEFERLAKHVADLGPLAGNGAFLPTASFCVRLRSEILILTATISGNRFGRSLLGPGGVVFDLFALVPVVMADSGDMLARALVRWLENQRSVTFIRGQLEALPAGPLLAGFGALAADEAHGRPSRRGQRHPQERRTRPKLSRPAARNTADVKWKRFRFLSFSEALGRPGLMPPDCHACDHAAAFLPAPLADGGVRLASSAVGGTSL